jgi:hypothetical protein
MKQHEDTEMTIEQKVARYIELRNQVADKARELKVLEAEVKPELEELEREMLEISNSTGVESFKTAAGTVFKTTKSYVTMKDREAFIRFALETGDYGLITNHIGKAHAVELIEEGVPLETLGVDYVVEAVMQFRK